MKKILYMVVTAFFMSSVAHSMELTNSAASLNSMVSTLIPLKNEKKKVEALNFLRKIDELQDLSQKVVFLDAINRTVDIPQISKEILNKIEAIVTMNVFNSNTSYGWYLWEWLSGAENTATTEETKIIQDRLDIKVLQSMISKLSEDVNFRTKIAPILRNRGLGLYIPIQQSEEKYTW